ncbi:MAG: hypothetical protein Q7K57_57225 [Burkholderiaceae bacterium]|nr:hypothetical protein [Burkholderiaceae bacterium]
MAEPTSTALAAATFVATSVSIPVLTAFGVPLGLRADLLIAGFAGSLVAIVLLNSVPSTGDTWRELVRTTVRRMAVAIASSLTAGYLTPLALLMANLLPDALLLSGAFAVGGGAQQVLMFAIRRFSGPALPPGAPT